MHKVQDVYNFLNNLSPFELQEKWDNSGLIIGNMQDEFNNIYLSIDIDIELVNSIENNSLIISHHPLIFSPLKKINFDNYSTKILQLLIKKDISLISMHTNIDKTHLNRYVAEEILGFNVTNEESFICYSDNDMSFDDLVKSVSCKLDLKNPKLVKCSNEINKIALTTGSGMSLLSNVKADCFLTGDIKYHDAMDASIRNINLIDIGHFESEVHFPKLLLKLLPKNLKKKPLQAIIKSSKNPFTA